MADAPGPDDPRYWERLRRGPPLDEWRPLEAPPRPRRLGAPGWVQLAIVAAGAVGVVALVNSGGGGGQLTFADMPVCTRPVTTDPCRDGASVMYAVNGQLVTFPTYDDWLAYVDSAAEGADQGGSNPTDFR